MHAVAGIERAVDVAVLQQRLSNGIEQTINRQRTGLRAVYDVHVIGVDQPGAGDTIGGAGIDVNAAQIQSAARGLDKPAVAATGAARGEGSVGTQRVGAEKADAATAAVAAQRIGTDRRFIIEGQRATRIEVHRTTAGTARIQHRFAAERFGNAGNDADVAVLAGPVDDAARPTGAARGEQGGTVDLDAAHLH